MPPRSGTLRRCHRTPGTASWEWRWACTRTWSANRPPCFRSTPRSGVSRSCRPRACPDWTLAGSPGRASVHCCRWRSRRWRPSCRWGCGGCRCLWERRKDWKARSSRKNHSSRTGVGHQRAFWLVTWRNTDRSKEYMLFSGDILGHFQNGAHSNIFLQNCVKLKESAQFY